MLEPLILITLLSPFVYAAYLAFKGKKLVDLVPKKGKLNISFKFIYKLLFRPDTMEDEGTAECYTKPTTELTDAELLLVASNILDVSEEHIFEHVRKETGTVTEYDRCFCVNGDFRLPPYMRQWIRKHLDTLRLTL